MKRLILLALVAAMLFALVPAALADSQSAYSGYVYIELTGVGQFKWFGLAKTPEESYSVPIQQLMSDGTTVENVIHITDKGFYMESSDCEGHDCVDMGEVTLENMNSRVLGGVVVCLPHQLYAELYTPEGFAEWYNNYKQQLGQ